MECITASELSKILHIGKNRLYSLLRANEIECILVGGRYLIPEESVKKYIEKKLQERKEQTVCQKR